jgi:hypothetical protein
MLWLITILFAGLPAFAAPKSRMSADAAPQGRPPFSIAVRGGFMLDTPDEAAVSRWDHKDFESFQVALSGFYSFPPSWKQFYFFAGPEFYYQNSTEELSGSTYSPSINTQVFQLMLTGGLAWQPWWLGGEWGASLATAFQAWGQKTAALDAQGFTQDLGTEDAHDAFYFNAILVFYYDWGNFRPQLVFETNSSIGLGMAYAF